MESDEVINKIKAKKKALGKKVVILTHHYQRQEIVELGHCSLKTIPLSEHV